MYKKKVIFNADDLGMSAGANGGILKAHKEGILTSASIIVTTPYYRDALENVVKKNPGLGIGLHLSLTTGRAIASLEKVFLLVNREGYLKWSFTSLFFSLRKFNNNYSRLIQQIEVELEAQFCKVIDDGINIDHVNSERHVHLIPPIFDIVIRLAHKYGVQYVRLIHEYIPPKSLWNYRLTPLINGGLIKYLLLSQLSRYNEKNMNNKIRKADYFFSILFTGRIDSCLLKKALHLLPNGITEINVHPGIPNLNSTLDIQNPSLRKYLNAPSRLYELEACIEAKYYLPKDIWLTNFKELSK